MENTTRKIKQCPHCKLEVDYQASRCPHCQGKMYVWTRGRKLVAGLIGVITLVSVGSATMIDTEPAATAQAIATPTVSQTLDVPSLVGKNLNELETALGTPSYDGKPTATYTQFSEIRTWEKTWSKGGYSLTATYDIDTQEVIDLFFSPAAGTDSASNILAAGNLSQNDSRYSVELVKALNASGYTGATVKAR